MRATHDAEYASNEGEIECRQHPKRQIRVPAEYVQKRLIDEDRHQREVRAVRGQQDFRGESAAIEDEIPVVAEKPDAASLAKDEDSADNQQTDKCPTRRFPREPLARHALASGCCDAQGEHHRQATAPSLALSALRNIRLAWHVNAAALRAVRLNRDIVLSVSVVSD